MATGPTSQRALELRDRLHKEYKRYLQYVQANVAPGAFSDVDIKAMAFALAQLHVRKIREREK